TVSIAGSDSEPGILEQPIGTGSWVYPQGYMAPGVPGPFAAEPAPTVESTEPVLTTDAPLDLSINKKKLEDLDRLLGKIQAMSSEQIMTQQNLGVRLLHWLAEPNPPTREEGEPRGIADIVSWKLKDPVQKLIDKMSSEQISLQDDNGKTALHIAVESGRDWFVEMLMNKMSAEQISLQDKTGKTALHLGFFKHRMKIIPLLKGRMSKEQIAIVDLEGKTAEELFLHQPFKSEKTASLPVKPAREKNLPVAVVLQIPMVPMLPSVRVGDGSVGNLQVSQRIMMDFNVAESLFNTGSAYVMCGPNADFATAANSFILSAMRYKQVAEGYAALREDIKARQAYLLSAEAYRSASLAYQSAGDQQNSQLALFDARLMSASFAGVSLAPQ
ncbi:MAG: ankyrin repeat domain-containing protein, partial [Myxococcaceae bacterium]